MRPNILNSLIVTEPLSWPSAGVVEEVKSALLGGRVVGVLVEDLVVDARAVRRHRSPCLRGVRPWHPASGMPIDGRIVDEVLDLLGGDQAVVVGVDVLPVMVGGEVVNRLVSLDRRDRVGHVDGGIRRNACPPGSVGGVETLPPSLASVAGTAVQARMPLMPLGVFQADMFLKACLPKLSEVGPTGELR